MVNNGKRLVVEIVRTRTQLIAQTSNMSMKTYKLVNNDFAAKTFKPRKMNWNKPTIVGALILDLSKRHMYWFHQKHMKEKFKTLVLYSDTDSMIYKIELGGLYEDLKNNDTINQGYDFSNCNENN